MILQKTEKINRNRLNNIPNFNEQTKEIILKYLSIENEYGYALREMSAKLENLDDYCQNHFDHNPIHHIESRIKSPESIIEKMIRRGYDLTFESLRKNIYDIAGIRVICKYIRDIYQIIDLLISQKDLKVLLRKDYIANPKETGYRSLHLVLSIELYIGNEVKTVPVEIQFRTLAMDMWASLEHELRYKSKNNLPLSDQEALKQYSEDLYHVDTEMEKIYVSTTKGVKYNGI